MRETLSNSTQEPSLAFKGFAVPATIVGGVIVGLLIGAWAF
jgi:hypothetical protein